MRNLLQFLIKHHFTLLFLFLEVVAVAILVRFNSYHEAKLYKIKHVVVGGIAEKFDNYSRYLSLEEQNKELVQENARLYNQLKGSMYFLGDDSFVDSVWMQQYRFVPARVVNNSVNKQYNFITLNKGKIHNIKEDMAVIGPNGIVGVVKTVTNHFCSVLPVLNRDSHPNARIKNSNYFGHIDWPGLNAEEVILKNIPLHARINAGDTVETSGHSTFFPPGVLIGTIVEYEIVEGVNYDILINLSTNFSNLTQVMIVENLLKEEQRALEEAVVND